MKTKNKLVKTENEDQFLLNGGFVIPCEVADGICLAVLKESHSYLTKELRDWKKNPKTDSNPNGEWMHPEDVVKNMKLEAAMDLLIRDYFSVPK